MLARLILCAALLCLTGTAGAHGDCGHLRSAFYEYGALYYKAADGSWTGIDKEVVDEVARRMGCTIEPTTDSRVRIWAGMNGGNIDMSVSTVSTPEREKFGRVIPYLSERNYVLLHQNVPAEVRSIDDFTADHGLRIGVIKSFRHGKFYDAWLTQLRAQGRVYEAADYPALLRLFKVGRVQAMMSISSGWYQLKQEKPPTPLRVMDWAPPKDSVIGGLILSRQHVDEATAERFSQAIRAMREDGTLKRIFERHLNAELAARLLNY